MYGTARSAAAVNSAVLAHPARTMTPTDASKTRKYTYERRCATRHRRRAAQDDWRLFGGGAGFFGGRTRRSSAQVRNAASSSFEGGAFRAAARIRIMRAKRLTTGGLVGAL